MKVLMTGHKGYIGSVMAAMFPRRGTHRCRAGHDLFEGCTFREFPRRSQHCTVICATSCVADLVGFRCRRPPGRPVQRPARERQSGV